jgi:RNA polymerase sigma-70 factor, ECF subfamily
MLHADFAALYERYSRQVWAVAYARWRNRDDADDMTQEAFLRLWKQREAGEQIANPLAWLLQVASRLEKDRAKSACRRKRRYDPPALEALENGQSRELTPEATVERDERQQEVRQAVATLAPDQRELCEMRYNRDLTIREISAEAKRPRNTVWSILDRAERLLQQRLAHLRDDDADPGLAPAS